MSTISAKARAIQKRSVKHLFRICRLSYDVHNPAFRCRPISYHCRNSTKIPSLIHSHNSRLLPLNKTNSFYSPVQNHLKFSTLSTTFSALPFPLKLATIVLSIPLCIYTYKSLVLILLQNKLIYMNYLPINSRHRMDMNPSEVGLSCTESTVQVEKGVKLQTWVLQDSKKNSNCEEKKSVGQEKTKVLVYFQGNAGNISHRLHLFKGLISAIPNLTIIAFGYRGYGFSTGRPSESGLIEDGVAILKFTKDYINRVTSGTSVQISEEKDGRKEAENSNAEKPIVVVYGHSLGGAVATHAIVEYSSHQSANSSSNSSQSHSVPQSRCPSSFIDLLILENTFTSVSALVKSLYPSYTPYHHLTLFLWNKWNVIEAIKQVPKDIDLLFVSGLKDEIVPKEMMMSLWEGVKSEGDDATILNEDEEEKDNANSESGTSKLRQRRVQFLKIKEGLHNTTCMESEFHRTLKTVIDAL